MCFRGNEVQGKTDGPGKRGQYLFPRVALWDTREIYRETASQANCPWRKRYGG